MGMKVQGLVAVFSVCVWLGARPAAAQGADPLAQAEEAYGRVDFEATLRLGQQALEASHYDRRQLARIYYLLGVARASLGQEDASREAYVRMLACDPQARIERDLSPQLRGPLLEARGYWNTTAPPGLEVQWLPELRILRFALTDPVGMVRRLVVRTREGRGAFTTTVVAAARSMDVEVPGTSMRVEYVASALDPHDNEVFVRGTVARPESAGADAPGTTPGALGPEPQERLSAGREGSVTGPLGVASLVVGGVAVVGGVVANVLREGYASRWNDDSHCLPPDGRTRQETCAGERSGADVTQALAIAGYVGGGVLLVTGAVLLWGVGRRGESHRAGSQTAALRFGPGPGDLGLACTVRF
jgi:hypothetical protein